MPPRQAPVLTPWSLFLSTGTQVTSVLSLTSRQLHLLSLYGNLLQSAAHNGDIELRSSSLACLTLMPFSLSLLIGRQWDGSPYHVNSNLP
jgi:hypothetical protein